MSAGYASRLSDYSNKGVCGLPENFDSKRAFQVKLKKLADWVGKSKHLVIITGAGISTSAGIPDFRGPSGVWTLENNRKKNNKKRKNNSKKQETDTTDKSTNIAENNNDDSSISTNNNTTQPSPNRKRKRDPVHHQGALADFTEAQPTLTHRAITKLASLGILKYCITQNVDGLHRRSGLPRSKHASLHGCVFTECCELCGAEHFRDYDVGGMSFQKTGRKCSLCSGDLRDTLLDWEDPLPEDDFERATAECAKSDLVITLGTSLRIEPVGSLPTEAEKFVIVNLQETPYDKEAAMTIRASVDNVMDGVLQLLGHSDWQDEKAPDIERIWKPEKSKTCNKSSLTNCVEEVEEATDNVWIKADL